MKTLLLCIGITSHLVAMNKWPPLAPNAHTTKSTKPITDVYAIQQSFESKMLLTDNDDLNLDIIKNPHARGMSSIYISKALHNECHIFFNTINHKDIYWLKRISDAIKYEKQFRIRVLNISSYNKISKNWPLVIQMIADAYAKKPSCFPFSLHKPLIQN